MTQSTNNPFFNQDFSKYMDMSNMSKMMSDMKFMPFSMEPMMNACRRNMETCATVNQSNLETMQTIMRCQTDFWRQWMEEYASTMNMVMTKPSPEEKVLCQAEMSKATVEKCLANVRNIADTIGKCQSQTMETVTARMGEGIEELRCMMKNSKAAA
jgi:phasin family protein